MNLHTYLSIKAPEPKRFNGDSGKLDVWLYSVKLYFGAVGWNVITHTT